MENINKEEDEEEDLMVAGFHADFLLHYFACYLHPIS